MNTILSVWRQHNTKTDYEHAQAKELAYSRQKCRCASCALLMQDGGVGIAFIDSNPNNLSDENVRAVCRICETLLMGGRQHKNHEAGYIVYLPNLSQKDIICMNMAYFNLKVDDMKRASVLQSFQYEELKKIRELAHKFLGFNDVGNLQELLLSFTQETYDIRAKSLGPIRWWPNIEDEFIRVALRKYKQAGAFLNKEDMEEIVKE